MFERKDNNPINNVTWKGVLLYLHHYVNEKVIDIIHSKNMTESDAITLLGIKEIDIYKARRKYLSDHGVNVFSEGHLYAGPLKGYTDERDWATFINHARVA
tara:strand:+ start:1028 stop:1330 length:303 start_codon:yes stop_codon:yes gene_type:complete